MIVLYRYVKKKRAEKKAAAEGKPLPTVTVEPVESINNLKPKSAPQPGVWKWRFILAVSLAIPVYLETLDYTVVATAQTRIASQFNALDLQSWIGTIYLLTSTVFLPFFASVADIYGRHFGLQSSLVLFIFGSALSTGARNMAMMIGGRAVAGIGGAGMLTLVRTVMADSSSLDDNNWQVGILFILYTIGYCTGPVIGGALIATSFRWIFAINLPTSVLAMVLIFFLIRKRIKGGQPPTRFPPHAKEDPNGYLSKFLRIDWIGTFFFVAGGILVLLALNWGSTAEWNTAKVIASFVIGGLCFVACLGWEYLLERQDYTPTPSKWRVLWAEPMIPLEVLKSYDVVAVQYGSFVSGMVILVMFYFVAIFLTIVLNYPPEKSGVQLIYFAPGLGGGTLLAVQMIRFLRQPKYPIILGSLIIPIALGLISKAMQNETQNAVNGYMAMAGVGCGLTQGSLIVQARFSLSSKRAAIVSALTLFFRSFGGTVGLAQCAAVLDAKARAAIANAVASGQISLSDAASLATSAQGPSSLDSLDQLPDSVQTVIRNAYRDGTRWAFISLIPWAVIGIVLVLFLSKIPEQIEDKNNQKEGKENGMSGPGNDIENLPSGKIEN